MCGVSVCVGWGGGGGGGWSDSQQIQHKRNIMCSGGDPDDFLSTTYCWVNDNECRHGVAYVLDPGDTVAFGTLEQRYTVQFEAKNNESAMMQMMMQVCCCWWW